MSSRGLIFVAAIFLQTGIYCQNQVQYEKVFHVEYSNALGFLSQNTWIADSISSENINPNFAVSIVFPEILRYSALKNVIEASALKTLYIQYGSKYSDFSIGYFQMKPSFAEKLEIVWNKFFIKNPNNKSARFDTDNSITSRKERIKRLDNIYWQVKYLCMFIKFLDLRHSKLIFADECEKLKFYATAYNYSFSANSKTIKSQINKTFFHTDFVQTNSTKFYSYSDISVYFFSNDGSAIFVGNDFK
jgi:hypothetical protein